MFPSFFPKKKKKRKRRKEKERIKETAQVVLYIYV